MSKPLALTWTAQWPERQALPATKPTARERGQLWYNGNALERGAAFALSGATAPTGPEHRYLTVALRSFVLLTGALASGAAPPAPNYP
jgi:hypothetical protein